MCDFKDKYRLTKEQSLFLAKKKCDENIYCGMKMENLSFSRHLFTKSLSGDFVLIRLGMFRPSKLPDSVMS